MSDEKDYDKRIDVLVHNVNTLKEELLFIDNNQDFEEMDIVIEDLGILSNDLEHMKASAGPADKEDVFQEGLRRISKLQNDTMSDELQDELAERVKGQLESWSESKN